MLLARDHHARRRAGPGAANDVLFLVPICKAGGARVAPRLPLHLDFLSTPGRGLPPMPWAAPKGTCLPCHGMRVSSMPPPVLPRQIKSAPHKSYQKCLANAQGNVSLGVVQWVQIKHVPAVGVLDGAGLRELKGQRGTFKPGPGGHGRDGAPPTPAWD